MVLESWMPATQITAAPATKIRTSAHSGSDPMHRPWPPAPGDAPRRAPNGSSDTTTSRAAARLLGTASAVGGIMDVR